MINYRTLYQLYDSFFVLDKNTSGRDSLGLRKCHPSSNPILEGHARKGQSGPRMSELSLGRQTQTCMRYNFEENNFCRRVAPDGPSSHACLCLSPHGATAPLAAFLGPRQKSRPLRYRGRVCKCLIFLFRFQLLCRVCKF